MIIIYDFDGTLTPFGIPQYEVLKRIGYDEERLLNCVKDLIVKEGIGLYQAFFKAYEDILKENNIEMNYENVILGAKDVVLNPGVLSYFEEMKDTNTGIKHYIVTSGFEEYVRNTKVSPLINGIYGVTYHRDGNIFTTVDRLVTDEEKTNIIKSILENNSSEKVVYVGDGLTDEYAFQYIHSIGGVSIFVGSSDKDFENYKALKDKQIVDEYFSRDFSDNSDFKEFIKRLASSQIKNK